MTSSERAHVSRSIERALMDCVAPPSKGGATNPSVSSSRFLVQRRIFDGPTVKGWIIALYNVPGAVPGATAPPHEFKLAAVDHNSTAVPPQLSETNPMGTFSSNPL